jgi:predicted Zn-dependent protease
MTKLPYSSAPLARLLAGHSGKRLKTKSADRGTVNSPEIFARLQQGMALQQQQKLGLAAEMYQGILAKYPNHPDALHLMGTVAMEGGEVDGALDLLKRAVAGKPADPSIRISLAHALIAKGDPEGAEFHLRKALKIEANLPEATALLATCRMARGTAPRRRQSIRICYPGTRRTQRRLSGMPISAKPWATSKPRGRPIAKRSTLLQRALSPA